jgi:hypothetical protein
MFVGRGKWCGVFSQSGLQGVIWLVSLLAFSWLGRDVRYQLHLQQGDVVL